jgi:hypothetical protein
MIIQSTSKSASNENKSCAGEERDNLFSRHASLVTYLILVLFLTLAVSLTYILYAYTQDLLKNRLQDKLIAISATAATEFDASDILSVTNESDLGKQELKRLVQQLIEIRDANQNVRYVYILRRTKDLNTLKFVADAEMLNSFEELDLNKNGIIEDEEKAPVPGTDYDVSEYPVLREYTE